MSVQPPTEVPPIGGRTWEWIVFRRKRTGPPWLVPGVVLFRQSRAWITRFHSAYWVRDYDWCLELEAFGRVFRLFHMVELRPEDY